MRGGGSGIEREKGKCLAGFRLRSKRDQMFG